MTCSHDNILASSINPFDRSYHHLQHEFDDRILQLLCSILHLNLTLVTTPLVTDLMKYERNPDSWILEQIVNGSAEISSTTITLTPDLPSETQYSFGIGTFRPQLYYKARSLREISNVYLLPFSTKVWISLLGVLLLLTAALMFILSREAKLPHEISYDVLARIMDLREDRDEDWTEDLQNTSKESLLQREKWETGEILLFCLGAMCQQGSARDPSTSAARLLLLVLFTLAVVTYTAFSASIISLISLFPSTEHEQLTRNVQNFSKEFKTLLHTTDKITQSLQFGFNYVEFTSLEKGFEKAIKGESVFVGDRDVSLTFLHQQNYNADLRCTLGRVFLGMEYQRVIAMKNESKHREKINYNIIRLKQFGLLQRERRRIFNVKPPCTYAERSSHSNFVSFNKNDVQPLVNLFKLGVITSILLLITEIIISYCPKGIRNLFSKPSKKKEKKLQKGKKVNEKSIPLYDGKSKIKNTALSLKMITPKSDSMQFFLP